MAKGRDISNEMSFWTLGFAAISLIIVAVIRWAYPLSYEHDLSRRPLVTWFVGYALSSCAISALVVATSVLWSKWLVNKPSLASFLSAINTFIVLGLYCIAVTKTFPCRLGLGIIDTINAKFLAEWQFVTFLGVIAPFAAILAALLTWIRFKYRGSTQ